ncbi:MAG TPA: hypothetical protein DD490_04860 [Acidobacteria bacterium]|nr:hypothetical protein [Acidobacteriota bacterium]
MRQRIDHRLGSPHERTPRPACSDWLTFVRPWLAATLVDRQAFERLRDVASRLPGDVLAALEIRLASDAGAVDLSVKLPPFGRLAEASFSPPIRQTLRRWATEGLPSTSSLWLELDLHRAPEGLPEPVLCAEVERGCDGVAVLDALVPGLDGGHRGRIVQILQHLAPPARALYLFDLRARGSRAIRLEIVGLPQEERHAFLARFAPHLADPVAAVAPLLAGTERPHLSFDVGPDRIEPRAGLEGSFVKWPHTEPRWRELFDRLVERGLCTPDRREAVFAWPGRETFWAAPGRWPVASAGTRGVCVRALSHVKIVTWVDRPPEAKVYLLFGWIVPQRPV